MHSSDGLFSANIETRFGETPLLGYIFSSRIICATGIVQAVFAMMPLSARIRFNSMHTHHRRMGFYIPPEVAAYKMCNTSGKLGAPIQGEGKSLFFKILLFAPINLDFLLPSA
jgi:hypothetical protein